MNKHKPKKIKNIIIEHIKTNAKEYLILIIVFIIGVTIGILFVNNTSEIKKQEIKSYIESFIQETKESKQINHINLFKDSITKNIIFAGLLWFMGIAVTLAPLTYAVIGFRGFCLGYTISSAVYTLGVEKGIIFSISLLLLQTIIQIPPMLAIAQSSLKSNKKLLRQTRKNRLTYENENVKLEMIRHSVFSMLMTGVLIVSSLIETYASTGLFIWALQFV